MPRLAAAYAAAILGALSLAGTASAAFPAPPALLSPSNAIGAARFGTSVALSANGDTAVIGAPADAPLGQSAAAGAAWVYTRSGGVWSQQAKLTPVDEVGDGAFGTSVAISADGNSVLIGAPQDGFVPNTSTPYNGAAFLFTRSLTGWTEQQKLTATDASSATPLLLGSAVALSADGQTALVGGFGDGADVGAAWVFRRTGTAWGTPQKLTANDESGAGEFGQAVALSADGSTALIAGDQDNNSAGAAWPFADANGTWAQQGPKLTGGQVSSCTAGYGGFGTGVALSGDGNTALIGDAGDRSCDGNAFVFTRSGATWATPPVDIAPSDISLGGGLFGWSVALTPDGQHALVGGWGDASSAGAAWPFVDTGGTWTQDGSKLAAAAPLDQLGYAVALSADSSTALAGANGAGSKVGAAWVFTAPPVIASLSPNSGPPTGGTVVTITGTGLQNATAVDFGSVPARSVTAVTPTAITVVAPAGSLGSVEVTVAGDRGTSTPTPASRFTYKRPEPPTLRRVHQSHRRWRRGRRLPTVARAARTPVGTTFSFTVDEAATVTLTFARGGRHRAAGRLRVHAARGAHTIAFDGRLTRRRKLVPGSYRLTLIATAGGGLRSKPAHLNFTIVPG